ncbi:MAG: DUF4358 domain-containing protein [Eubacteriales bacterium]|nr:DUF4358 domain-containing protein [Eubacteriales bacterium]
MKLWEDKRAVSLAVIAVFILFIFIWGTVSTGRGTTGSTKSKQTAQEEPQATASGAEVDIQELTNQLLNDVKYETTLELMDSSLADGMVNIEKGSTMELYMGEGTCADELVVVRATDEESAKKNQTAVEKHLKDMKQSFEDYIPEQADKIGRAVIVRCGVYVVACVTSDGKHAQDMIVEAFQQ